MCTVSDPALRSRSQRQGDGGLHRAGHKTRGWLLFTMSVQIALLIFNIILVSPAMAGVLPEGGPFEWAVIFTAAAQGAGQMVMVSVPQFAGLPPSSCSVQI